MPLTGEEVFKSVEHIDCKFGKKTAYKVNNGEERPCWKKKSIFFELEYWKYHHVRHCIDVMHVEKNVCNNIIGTLLNIPKKTKDGVAARLDLLEMGIKSDLQPEFKGKRVRLPLASWNLLKEEKKVVCNSLHVMKVPEGIHLILEVL